MNTMDATPHANNGELLKVLTRLMTPFRREFQQFLDVNRLLVDPDYAREILDKLLQSENPNIVGAGHFLRSWIKSDSSTPPPASAGVSSHTHSAPPPAAVIAAVPPPVVPVSTSDPSVAATKYVKRLR